MVKPVRIAVIPLAGLGTRMLPITRAVPKFLFPVYDRPAIAHIAREARSAGITRFVFVISPGLESLIIPYFSQDSTLEAALKADGKSEIWESCATDFLPESALHFAHQAQPLGLGDAVLCAREQVGDEPFAVLLPDVLTRANPSCLAQMHEAYLQTGGNMVAIDEIPEERTASYGVIRPAPDADLSASIIPMIGMVEKPASNPPSCLKLTGRYILQPEIFSYLDTQAGGAGGEVQLTDAMARLMEVQSFHAARYQGTDYDCGAFDGYCEAVAAYGLDDPKNGPAIRAALGRRLAED